MAPERSKKGKKKTVKKDGGNTREYTPEMLIEQGNVALGNMQLELAAEFFNRALNLSPDDTNIMDALADVMIQLGEQEKALELLLRSTQSAPTVNPYKWFFLGQLQLEFDAVKCYRTGIQILMSIINSEGDAEVQATTTKQVAKAYCSIAEIYLTDLCFEEDAEKVCEEAVAAALQICPGSLDAMQTLASIRLSQQRKSEAGDIITKVYSELMRIREIVSARTVVQEMCGAEEPAELRDAPELSFCVATVKLLIECAGDAAHGALYTMALELGEGLLLEDDENIELWYLMGVACMGNFDTCAATQQQQQSKAAGKQEKAGEEEEADLAAAQYHFETALQLMDKLKEEARREGMVDGEFIYQDQYGLVQEHLRIIAAATGEGSASGSGMAVQAVPADEEWSDGEEGGMAVDEAS